MRLRLPRVLVSIIVLLCAGSGRAAEAGAPADPGLNPRARAILAWFQQLQAAPELKLVSGQFAGWSGRARMDELGQIERATGRWPAMIGLDYCAFVKGQATIATQPVNALAQKYWNAGGLVSISWHAPNPGKPKGGGLKERGVKLADLLTPGPTHDRWMKSLDEVSAGLARLQEAGVVVIWRPLHEMNGAWFWWGAQEPADFIAVWRHMFEYFTQAKGLHNLIWAWGPNHAQRPPADYYPGDAFTDLIGLDAYTDHINPDRIKGFESLTGISKPTGFTEYGPHGASNPPGDYDFRQLLDGIEQNFPQLRHFLVWNENWNPARNRFAREFYNDPRVITRDRIPAGLAGK